MLNETEATLTETKIVFIVGSARSGTTWLQSLMQQSRQVACVSNETHLFNHYIKPLFNKWQAMEGHITGIRHLVSDQEFFDWMNGLVQMCFQRVAETNANARLIVEKTPNHSDCGSAIIRCLPDSYFIHIIRDPRASVTSLRAASSTWGSNWAPSRLGDGCSIWKKRVVQARSIAALTDRYREIQYEQLHADVPGELIRLFDWLGEPISRQQAEAYAAGCTLDSMRTEAAKDAEFVSAAAPSDFFRRGEVDSWRTELPPTEVAIVERLTRKEMTDLGYEPISGPRARLAARARIKTYRAAARMAKRAQALAERIKP